MEKITYQKLYQLQDEVLNIVFTLENDFYLTGGTALHRFYYNGRYSDDLDFFVSNSQTFSEDINEIIQLLKEQNYKISHIVTSRDFYRVIVNDVLQLDFVNDRVYRYKKSNLINNFRIDNKINILTNKLTTIISRDEEKDIFDLFYLAFHETFNWDEMIEIANKKSLIETDILLYRIKSFPLEWLDRIKKIEDFKIEEADIVQLVFDIQNGDNTLYKRKGF